MKLIKSIILCGMGAAALGLTSCNDWLDVNTNPNIPTAEAAKYEQRLAHIQFYTNDAYMFASWRSNMACGDWTRNVGGGTYFNMSVWYPTNSIVTTSYQWWFVGAYANVPDMIAKANAAGNKQFEGAGYLIKAYGNMLMTDLYGEMPYTEAAGANALPKYDTGKTIFMGCLADIDKAIELLEAGRNQAAEHPTLPTLAANDSWNNGDIDKWIKLAHLLKARFMLHLSKKASGSYLDGKYDAEGILAELDKAMQSNADNTVINHTDNNSTSHDVLGWDEPVDYSALYSVSGMNSGYMITKMYYDNLTNFAGCGIEDPRADKIIPWAVSRKSADTPAEIKWQGEWRRSLGLDLASNINSEGGPIRPSWDKEKQGFYIDSDNAARFGDTVYVEQTSSSKGYAKNPDLYYYRGGVTQPNSRESGTFYTRVSSPTYVGTYAEVCFIRAEVLFNLGRKAEAYDAYKKGVKASMELMNEKLAKWCSEDENLKKCPSFTVIPAADIDNYVNNALGTASDITLGKIMTQKRIAMFFSMETWNDMRRYDYNPEIFLGWKMPAYHKTLVDAMKAIPEGKQFRRWRQCSHELDYNADNLQAIGAQVPGADMSLAGGWNKADDVWTIPVWWDSDQE